MYFKPRVSDLIKGTLFAGESRESSSSDVSVLPYCTPTTTSCCSNVVRATSRRLLGFALTCFTFDILTDSEFLGQDRSCIIALIALCSSGAEV